jgi:hypothetical protein
MSETTESPPTPDAPTPQRPERRRMLMVDWMTQHRGGWDDWHDNWDR